MVKNPDHEKQIQKLTDYLNKSGLIVDITNNNYKNLLVSGYGNTLDLVVSQLKLCALGKVRLSFLPDGQDHIDLFEVFRNESDGGENPFYHLIKIRIGETLVNMEFED